MSVLKVVLLHCNIQLKTLYNKLSYELNIHFSICIQVVLFRDEWNPPETLRVGSGDRCPPLDAILVLLQDVLFLENDMFPFPVFDHTEGL